MKSLLDRSFRYTPSYETDLKATFARVRRELRQAQAKTGQPARPRRNVLVIAQENTRAAVRPPVERNAAQREAK
jgi:hypothetical protein